MQPTLSKILVDLVILHGENAVLVSVCMHVWTQSEELHVARLGKLIILLHISRWPDCKVQHNYMQCMVELYYIPLSLYRLTNKL